MLPYFILLVTTLSLFEALFLSVIQKVATNIYFTFQRELKLRLVERRAVVQVVGAWLERFMAQWKPQAEAQPSVARFTEAFTACVSFHYFWHPEQKFSERSLF